MRRCFEWELRRGLIQISYALLDPTEAFELRMYAGAGFEMSVNRLVISTLP